MDYLSILIIALGLSFDTFAVSLSYGVIRGGILFQQASWIAIVLAGFQGGLTVAGYYLGSIVSDILKSFDHWVALILLTFLGIKMIVESYRSRKNEETRNFNSNVVLITIALSTSIDAFAVGISFALLDVKIWEAGILIGAVTFLASMTAIRIGKSASERLGTKVEVIGGILLIAIGLKIFIQHVIS